MGEDQTVLGEGGRSGTRYVVLVAEADAAGAAIPVFRPVVELVVGEPYVAGEEEPVHGLWEVEAAHDRDAIAKTLAAVEGLPVGASFVAVPARSFRVRRPKPRQGLSWS